jgi:hypothetical protein
MIDVKNPSFVKLPEVDNATGVQMVGDFLIDEEEIYSSLPYSKIQAFSVETAGTLDRDADLELWFSGLGKVRFEFNSQFDVKKFSKFIGKYILWPRLPAA